jgi:hypothetical protein
MKKWKQDVVRANWRLTLREVNEKLRISFGLCQEILTNNWNWEVCQGNLSHDRWLQSRSSTSCLQPSLTSNVQTQMKISLKTLQLVIKHGCTVMTPKLNTYCQNGKHFHHHTPRKQDKFDARQRWWLSTFFY